MTLLIFQSPWLIFASMGCGWLAFAAAKKRTRGLSWLCTVSVTALAVAALACMIPYPELVLLLLPAVYGAFLGEERKKP